VTNGLARRPGARYALAFTPPFEAGSGTHPRGTLACQERKVRVSSPTAAKPSRVFKARCRAGGTPSREERGGSDPHYSRSQPLSGRCPPPGGFSFRDCSPARCEQAGDGRGRRNRIPALARPPGFRPGPADLAGSSSTSRRRPTRTVRFHPRIR
jgi:hypothetical protein